MLHSEKKQWERYMFFINSSSRKISWGDISLNLIFFIVFLRYLVTHSVLWHSPCNSEQTQLVQDIWPSPCNNVLTRFSTRVPRASYRKY